MSLGKPHILVAEDSRPEAHLLKLALESAGYRVTVAPDGDNALTAVEAGDVSLLISDVEMPGRNGYEICSGLKADARWREIPVILLTSHSRIENILQGLSAQADFYITKPYSRPFLLQKVSELLTGAARMGQDDPGAPLQLELAGRQYSVSAGRRQMLTLLLSTYENSLRQNEELTRAQAELNLRNAELREQRARLEDSERSLREQTARLEKANASLEALACLDGLTGLLNRRTFQQRLEDEFRRAQRDALPMALLMVDVDHFKSFNDQFGHPAGDTLLKSIALTLLVESRASDFVGRWGGEEFSALLVNTDKEGAAAVAERIRRVIEDLHSPHRKVTASFGAAVLEKGVRSAAELVEKADKALYESKASGRNRVTLASCISEKAS